MPDFTDVGTSSRHGGLPAAAIVWLSTTGESWRLDALELCAAKPDTPVEVAAGKRAPRAGIVTLARPTLADHMHTSGHKVGYCVTLCLRRGRNATFTFLA